MKEVTILNNKPRSEIVEMLCRIGVPVSTAVEMADKIKNDFYALAPRAYICSPLKASTPKKVLSNMQAARSYIKAAEYECGVVGIAPHAYLPEVLNDNNPLDRKIAVLIGLRYLAKCSELYVCGNRITSGMFTEIQFAVRKKIPITVFNRNIYAQVCKIAGKHAQIAAGKSGMLALPAEMLKG